MVLATPRLNQKFNPAKSRARDRALQPCSLEIPDLYRGNVNYIYYL